MRFLSPILRSIFARFLDHVINVMSEFDVTMPKAYRLQKGGEGMQLHIILCL